MSETPDPVIRCSGSCGQYIPISRMVFICRDRVNGRRWSYFCRPCAVVDDQEHAKREADAKAAAEGKS